MSTNPFEPPSAPLDNGSDDALSYAGFWIRVLASVIDGLLVLVLTYPLLIMIYGMDYLDPERTGLVAGPADILLNWVLPAVVVVAFWVWRGATPGKMLLRLKIVDARTGGPLSVGQAIGRYLGYIVSSIPFGLGLIWVAFDKRKQGWHDKLARTVVVRNRKSGTEPVRFEGG